MRQGVTARRVIRQSFQKCDGLERPRVALQIALAGFVGDLDGRGRLAVGVPVRFEQRMPSVFRVLVVSGAAAPAFLWYADRVCQFLELLLVGANHQTDDLEGALPVEAVRVGEIEVLALFAVAAIR